MSIPTAPSASGQRRSLVRKARLTALRTALAGTVVARRLAGNPGARLVTPRGRADPYPIYHQVRRRGQVVPSLIGNLIAHHELADRVLRDYQRFGSAPVPGARPVGWTDLLMTKLAEYGDENAARRGRREAPLAHRAGVPDPLGPESMLGMNPPDHTRLRRVVSRAFTPRAVEGVRGRVEEVAAELLDSAPADGFDLMDGYADVLPVVVISELLGVPTADGQQMKLWGDAVASSLDVLNQAPRAQIMASLRALNEYFLALFAERRRHPGDKVIDTLLAGTGQNGLSDRELMATALLLLAAGFETTVNLVGSAVLALLEYPEQRRALINDPALMPNAVEEILRWDPPVQLTSRTVREDTTLGGRRLRRGAQLVVLLAGANRDPAVFDDPDRFDVTRSNARDHLSFVTGVHHCLGAPLARLEGEVALRLLITRYPDLELAGPAVRGRGLILRGPRSVPLRLGRPTRAAL
jgi:cytochrome P450